MTETELKEIMRTCDRIENALNRRFEKDAELYISKEGANKIKKALKQSRFENITNMYKTELYSADIIVRVVTNNVWLVHNSKIGSLQKIMKKILADCNISSLKDIKSRIDEDEIESHLQYKDFFMRAYYQSSDVSECHDYIEQSNVDNYLVGLCALRVIAETPSNDDKWKLTQRFIKTLPAVKNDHLFLSKLIHEKLNDVDSSYFFARLSEIMDEHKDQKIYENAYTRYGLKAFAREVKILENLHKTSYVDKQEEKKRLKYIRSIINSNRRKKDYFGKELFRLYTTIVELRHPLYTSLIPKLRDLDLIRELDEKMMGLDDLKVKNNNYVMRAKSEIMQKLSGRREEISAQSVFDIIMRQSYPASTDSINFIISRFQEAHENGIVSDILKRFAAKKNNANRVFPQLFKEIAKRPKCQKLLEAALLFLDEYKEDDDSDNTFDIIEEKVVNALVEVQNKSNAVRYYVLKYHPELAKDFG